MPQGSELRMIGQSRGLIFPLEIETGLQCAWPPGAFLETEHNQRRPRQPLRMVGFSREQRICSPAGGVAWCKISKYALRYSRLVLSHHFYDRKELSFISIVAAELLSHCAHVIYVGRVFVLLIPKERADSVYLNVKLVCNLPYSGL